MTTLPVPALSLRDARLSVGDRVLWSGLDLELQAGEFLAVLGPNGVGKSTLLRAVLGQQPLAAGQVLVGGRPPGRGSATVGDGPPQKSMGPPPPPPAPEPGTPGLHRHPRGGRRGPAAARPRGAQAAPAP